MLNTMRTHVLLAVVGLSMACGSDVQEDPEPVEPCANAENYAACVRPDDTAGVCLYGTCRRACKSENDCIGANSCSAPSCFWGYCSEADGC
jgi:hypothetical protein